MSASKQRMEGMLFNYESTLRTDFRGGEILPIVKTEYVPKSKRGRGEYTPIKNTHTLTDWKNPIVPFDVYGAPKEVVRTNPRVVQKPFAESEDTELDEVRKTRPRLVMTPAVSMDDIDNDHVRATLLEDIYKSTYMKASREILGSINTSSPKSPFPGRPAPPKPIYLQPLRPGIVAPELRMDSVSWDNRQLRAYSDCTKKFWLSRTPNCEACETTARLKAMKKIEKQMRH